MVGLLCVEYCATGGDAALVGEWSCNGVAGTIAVYNRPMSQSRTTTGILLIILLAVIGYVLVTIPPRLVEQYHNAAEISPWIGYVYLAVVGFGSLLLGGLLLAILLHVWRNTRQKAADRERRNLSPSQMSAGAQTQEIDDNLATGREVAAAGRVTPELQAEIAAAVEELEAKRQSQQLEIVAFGTISSGKSSLLNALAGRHDVSHERGRRHDRRAERDSLAGGRPGRAGRYAGAGRGARRIAGGRMRPRRRRMPTWCCSSSMGR